jgi:ABC-type nitrate/sulfonate/bicarbonate transport system substrate-binding protein
MVMLDDFGAWDILPSVVLFQRRVVEERPEAVAAFHAAVDEAIERLNATGRPDLIASGLDVVVGLFFQAADTSLIGQDVLDAISVPVYLPMKSLPAEQYDGVVEWMKRKGYVLDPPVYNDFVDFQFLQ